MTDSNITEKDRELARQCLECTICNTARIRQRGFAFWFVKCIEGSLCPQCRAYEKVYGKKAHEPLA